MKIAVLFVSQRNNGNSNIIEKRLLNYSHLFEFDFIRMSELKIEGCVACAKCAQTGKCILPSTPTDMFEVVFSKLKNADVILVITPIYSPYPSRLTALMERLLSISYFSHELGGMERPLINKKTGIICYGSSKIEDDTQLKLLFQKYLMDNYSFTDITYDYLNDVKNPNSIYNNVVDYVEDIVKHIPNIQ